MELNKTKLKAMVHYIAEKAPNRLLGKVKLNKILWFSDREAYIYLGRTISGETYLKFRLGPVSQHIQEIVDELVKEKKVAVRKVRDFDHERFEFISLESMSTEEFAHFSPEEISILDEHIAVICYKHTAKSISDLSHDETWRAFPEGVAIPFTACLSRKSTLSSDDREWIAKHGAPSDADLAWLNA